MPTSLTDEEFEALRTAYLTEVQAVAIYEAECGVLRRSQWGRRRRLTFRICARTLLEEHSHADWLKTRLASSAGLRAVVLVNRLAGMTLGLFLALLPSRLSWICHDWAEGEAALAYERARLAFRELSEVAEFLEHAAAGERVHQLRFRRFLRNWQISQALHKT